MQLSFELPELDRKKTQEAVEDALEKYRIFKFISLEEREATITASYELREGGASGKISDQTAQIAIHNVDAQGARRAYCERIERAVKRLHPKERLLIEARYMKEDYDGEYVRDYKVYSFVFNPPISEGHYVKIRWKAFYKLALFLNIAVEKIKEGD